MGIKVGDKYIIEIGEKFTGAESMQARYRIKGFDSLVFDKKGLDRLEPVEKAWEAELAKAKAKEYGYSQGYEDGNKIADKDLKEIQDSTYDVAYTKGYNTAINDYNAMYEWLHDCFVDFKKFLLEKGFYTDEKFLDGFVVGQLMYDLICDHDIAKVISEFQKWQEEKKKAEEVENYHILVDTLRTITEEYPKETIVSALSEFGFEVDKLRGEE